MHLDRDETLKLAERLLRQGRLEQAIAEYARVAEEHPHDWTTANQLGDLYARTGQVDRAVAQLARCADQLLRDRDLAKAAAVYKKILKIAPADEKAQLQLAEISVQQGLLMDARTSFIAVAERRRRRGDHAGAHEMDRRIATLETGDFDGRVSRARSRVCAGEFGAIADLKKLVDQLVEQGRDADAVGALRDVIALDTADVHARRTLVHTLMRTGDAVAARELLTADVAGDDPALQAARAEHLLRNKHIGEGRAVLRKLLEEGHHVRVEELAATLDDTDAVFACVDAIADGLAATGQWADAAAVMRTFTLQRPDHIPGLLKRIELCVDAGLEPETCEAQAQLADAYIAGGAGDAAVAITSELVQQQPAESRHRERHQAALRLVGRCEAADEDQFAAFTRDGAASRSADEMPPATTRRSGEIDLTAALTRTAQPVSVSDVDDVGSGLEEVFLGFRAEVARDRADEVAEHHFKLAIAYRDIGMLEGAIEALQVAARSPRLLFDAAAMIGRLYRQRHMPAAAVEWLERAAETPPPDAAAGRELLYDLGHTLMALGEHARALAVFLELQADAGDYRDLTRHIEQLSVVQAGG